MDQCNEELIQKLQLVRQELETWIREHDQIRLAPGESIVVRVTIERPLAEVTTSTPVDPSKNILDTNIMEFFTEERLASLNVSKAYTLARIQHLYGQKPLWSGQNAFRLRTIGDIVKVGADGLRRWQGCGKYTISVIRAALKAVGVTLPKAPMVEIDP